MTEYNESPEVREVLKREVKLKILRRLLVRSLIRLCHENSCECPDCFELEDTIVNELPLCETCDGQGGKDGEIEPGSPEMDDPSKACPDCGGTGFEDGKNRVAELDDF